MVFTKITTGPQTETVGLDQAQLPGRELNPIMAKLMQVALTIGVTFPMQRGVHEHLDGGEAVFGARIDACDGDTLKASLEELTLISGSKR